MVSVLVVSDQSLQRRGLRMLLAAEPGLTVVGEAASSAEAVRMITSLRPGVVLMNCLSEPDGIATIQHIAHPPRLIPRAASRTSRATETAGGHAPRVLVLAPVGAEDHSYAALRAGAAGFLMKDATPDELVAAIRVVAAGDAVITPGLTRALIDTVRRQSTLHTFQRDVRLDTFTVRERDVLTAVASGWSNAEIAAWLCISPTTVKSHVSHILAKIGARARVQAVTFAYESGLVRPAAA